MKKIIFFLCFGFVLACGLSSCFSLMKADKMVYAGSLGKKVDAVLIDSVFNAKVSD